MCIDYTTKSTMPTLRNNSKGETSQGDKKPKYALWKKYETRKNVPLHAAHRQNTNMQLIKTPVWDDYKGAFKYTFEQGRCSLL